MEQEHNTDIPIVPESLVNFDDLIAASRWVKYILKKIHGNANRGDKAFYVEIPQTNTQPKMIELWVTNNILVERVFEKDDPRHGYLSRWYISRSHLSEPLMYMTSLKEGLINLIALDLKDQIEHHWKTYHGANKL